MEPADRMGVGAGKRKWGCDEEEEEDDEEQEMGPRSSWAGRPSGAIGRWPSGARPAGRKRGG